MNVRRQHRFLGMAAGAALALAGVAHAGPNLIKDSRVWDHTTTPVLGRGYSQSTNTFQSTCLSDILITEPSYDFNYSFDQVDKAEEVSGKFHTSWSKSFIFSRIKASGDVASQTKTFAQNVVVLLNMDTYYASVDEANSKVSESARTLLQNQDLPGFFAACGPTYVRGITRNAQFVSVLTYFERTDKRDLQFEAQLKGSLFGVSGSMSGEVHTTAQQKRLQIYSQGWGLGKNEGATLISYDLETFKKAIKDAFVSMQDPLTGRVTSVEMVPWVENTDFQSLVNLRGRDVIGGKEVPLYKKKDILTFNAEFLAEAERAARNRLNMYYKAKLCKDTVEARWGGAGDGKGGVGLREEASGVQLRNNRTVSPALAVSALTQKLTDAHIEQLWTNYATFMFEGDKANVTTCINDLLRDPNQEQVAREGEPGAAGTRQVQDFEGMGRGIFLKRYTEVESCKTVAKDFAAQLDQQIEDYCMPEQI